VSRGFPFTEEDIEIIKNNPLMSERALADKLGRTPTSIKNVRYRIKHRGFEGSGSRSHSDAPQFDERPSGWYTEVIGTLLMQFPDAFESWKHYHRYVEIKEAGTPYPGDSYTYLFCRRDAEAP
jgi:hypothetical protein